jgi:hypothetical protein
MEMVLARDSMIAIGSKVFRPRGHDVSVIVRMKERFSLYPPVVQRSCFLYPCLPAVGMYGKREKLF